MRVGTHGMIQVDYEQRMDFDRMRRYRVGRIKQYMDQFDIECLLLFESGNKRYATSTAVASPEVDNMGRYAIVPRNGEPHIFGFGSEVAAEKLYCPWIADYTFPAHGTMHGALPMAWKCYEVFLKDLDMVLAAGETAGVPLPSVSAWRDRLVGAIAHGEGEQDWAVVARDQARASGLE